MRHKHFLAQLDKDLIEAAIKAAEAKSTGEIRVHVHHGKVGDAQHAAARRFEELGMTATKDRSGVLIYVAPESRSFAIIGDRGIHEKCGLPFWTDVAGAMERHFRDGHFTDGIVHGIEKAGTELARHFSRTPGQAHANELPDEVTED
jgi:uncharacterized membrane protein